MTPISVIICCCNNEKTIEAACRSCAWADELIVLDSGSTDRTVEIARKYTDRIVVEPWRGHSRTKRFAADKLATHDWIFFVDSDEEVDEALAEEIQSWDQAYLDQWDLILVPRKNWILGRYVKAWDPDYLTRIFNRQRVTWNDHALHDARDPKDPNRVTRCKGHLLHNRVVDTGFSGGYFSGKRLDSRLLPVAVQMYQRGQRCRWWDLLLRPWGAFFKFYFIKRSCLDGTFGLLIAQKAAVSTQLKYAALWAVQNDPQRYIDESDATKAG